jgi:photosystem II stability/assembly factor-like uncharacterized protein
MLATVACFSIRLSVLPKASVDHSSADNATNQQGESMKKLFLAFTILIFLTACAGNVSTPAPIPPTATSTAAPVIHLPLVENPQLTQFYFFNENDGWGATETKVVRTDNGGVTWYDATPAAQAQFSYAPYVFFDAQTAWLLVGEGAFNAGVLFHTTDGGVTWTSNAVPFGFASLQFLDASNGFALVALGAGAGSEAVALFKTNDGGLNWARVFVNDPNDAAANNSLPLGGQKSGFTFRDASNGWVGGSTPVDGYIYLYRTRDGGSTWSEINLALPAGYESAQTGNDGPRFFSATQGILVVTFVMPSAAGLQAVVYRTSDGGETWTPGQVIAAGRVHDFASFSDGFAWGNGSQLLVTRDAGQTWGAVTSNEDFSASLVSFQFASPLVGWVLTTTETLDPSLYKTTDGGATWTLLIP